MDLELPEPSQRFGSTPGTSAVLSPFAAAGEPDASPQQSTERVAAPPASAQAPQRSGGLLRAASLRRAGSLPRVASGAIGGSSGNGSGGRHRLARAGSAGHFGQFGLRRRVDVTLSQSALLTSVVRGRAGAGPGLHAALAPRCGGHRLRRRARFPPNHLRCRCHWPQVLPEREYGAPDSVSVLLDGYGRMAPLPARAASLQHQPRALSAALDALMAEGAPGSGAGSGTGGGGQVWGA